MPELPEVETIRLVLGQGLADHLARLNGHQVRQLQNRFVVDILDKFLHIDSLLCVVKRPGSAPWSFLWLFVIPCGSGALAYPPEPCRPGHLVGRCASLHDCKASYIHGFWQDGVQQSLPSVDKGKYGFSVQKQCLTSFPSLPGVSLAMPPESVAALVN